MCCPQLNQKPDTSFYAQFAFVVHGVGSSPTIDV